MDRLTAQDLMMVWPERRGWSQDIAALLLLDGHPLCDATGALDLAAARAAVASRLHLLPRFRQVLHMPRTGLGWPLWVDAAQFDLTQHVRTAALPPEADEVVLLDVCATLRQRRLVPTRPLWEMVFLTGLPAGRIGVFLRMHHAIADGMAGVAALAALLDATAESPAPHMAVPWTPTSRPSDRALLRDNITSRCRSLGRVLSGLRHPLLRWRAVRRGWPALREALWEERAPAISLNAQPIGRRRRYAIVRGRLAQARETGHAHGGTVNDVLLTTLAAGLRELLIHRGETVDELVLRAAVPVALHDEAHPVGNRDGMMAVPLPVGEPDHARRLARIAAETAQRKHKAYLDGGTIFRTVPLQRAFMALMGHQRFINTYAANVPGPDRPLFFAGARVLECIPIVPPQGNLALSVGALSYDGQFNMLVVADRDLVPDLDVFVAGARGCWASLSGSPTLAEGSPEVLRTGAPSESFGRRR